MKLKGKVALVVGASRGFGAELAACLVAEGCKVVVVSKTAGSIQIAAKKIGATPLVADVRNESELRRVARTVMKKFGALDIWINCAGVFKVFPRDELIDMHRAHELFDVNFFGTVFGSRTALLTMKEGTIVNILSSAALDATRAKNAKLYAASKWAVRGYVEALRNENARKNVTILSVYPGGMKTHLHDEQLPAEFDDFMEPTYVADKVVKNLKQDIPVLDLIIKRPKAE